jgi:putative ABC transport system ATP-binding protein
VDSFLSRTAVLIPPLIELTQVPFVVRPGEYVAILGPAGSGTSSLLHILGCLVPPERGEYRLAGYDVNGLSEEELADLRNRQVGFVFGPGNLLPSLTAGGNVGLPLRYAGVPRAARRARVNAALAVVGLAGRVNDRPRALTVDERDRLAVARALVTEPALILADEPADTVLAIFDVLHAAGHTVVIGTREPTVAARADRIVSLRNGMVVSDR